MADRIGAFKPEVARAIHDAYKMLVSAGFITPDRLPKPPQFAPQTPIYIKNGSGVVVPPYACMQSSGTYESGEQNYITIGKPVDTTATAGAYFFNGPHEIAVGEYGTAFAGPLVRAYSFVSTSSTNRWVPVVGEWFIGASSSTGGPFVGIGADDVYPNTIKIVVTYSYGADVLECADANRPITDIRFSSPNFQYRKGPACEWTTWATGTTCSGPTASPSGLTSTGTTTTTVSLSWTDNSSNEDGFYVEYKTSAGSVWTVFTTTAANATTSTVTGLTAGTSYDFRVAAMNSYGTSSYSTASGISTAASP